MTEKTVRDSGESVPRGTTASFQLSWIPCSRDNPMPCYKDTQKSPHSKKCRPPTNSQRGAGASRQQPCGEPPWTWLLQPLKLAEEAILAEVLTTTSRQPQSLTYAAPEFLTHGNKEVISRCYVKPLSSGVLCYRSAHTEYSPPMSTAVSDTHARPLPALLLTLCPFRQAPHVLQGPAEMSPPQ